MKIAIRLKKSPEDIVELVTEKIPAILGRSPHSDLVLPDQSVSRSHCKLECEENKFFLTDLGSSNGTFVDGVKLIPHNRIIVTEESKVIIGGHVCEVVFSEGFDTHKPTEIQAPPIEKGGDTSTISVRYNRPIQEPKVKNPVSSPKKKNLKKKNGDSKSIYIFLFLAVSIALIFLINKGLS